MLIKKPGAGDPAHRAFDPAASRPLEGGGSQPLNNAETGTSALDALRDAYGGSGLLERGHILQGRYEVEQVLGIGGMSAVYRARDLRFVNVIRYCAVKEMPDNAPDPRTGELRLATFEREASLLATLNHPGIIKIYDFFADRARVYLVLEYIEGSDLESVLEQNGGPLAINDVLRWSIEICDVLAYLHRLKPQPIVFRDLKPSNIMISKVALRSMLIDFGIAKIFQSDKRGTMIGTEGYSPPEQYRGMSDPRVDIYALGATLHHLLTNSDPRLETPFTFQERLPRDLNQKISEQLQAVIMKALEYNADRRWQSAEALKAALEECLQANSGGQSTAIAPQPASAAPAAWPRSGNQPQESQGQVRQGTPPQLPQQDNTPRPATEPTTELLWSFDSEDEIRSAALVAKGIVFFGSYDSNLYALNAKSGDFLWKYATEAGICTQPALANDLVIVGSEDHSVYGIEASRGAQSWRFRGPAGPVRSSPRVTGFAVYFGSDDQQLYCIDGRNGQQLWKFAAWGPVRSTPVVAGETIYVGSHDANLYAIDSTSGQLKWKFRTGAPITSSPFVHEGLVLVGSADQQLYAIDVESGFPVWKYRTGHYVNSSPVVENGRVFFGSVDGALYAIDMNTGRPAWKFETGSQIISSPRVANNAVYFGVTDGSVLSLGRNGGELRWRFRARGPVTASPIVEDGIVYIGSFDHTLYALAM